MKKSIDPCWNYYTYLDRLPVGNRVRESEAYKLCSESFVDELSIQITNLLSKTLGVHSKSFKKIDLTISVNEKIFASGRQSYYEFEGYTYKFINLRDFLATEYGLAIRWHSKELPCTYVKPTQGILQNSVEFELCYDLPSKLKEIIYEPYIGTERYEYAMKESTSTRDTIERLKAFIPYLKISNAVNSEESGFSFDYTINCGWPDVTIEIKTDNSDYDNKKLLKKTIELFYQKWNEKQTRKNSNQFIHAITFDDLSKKSNGVIAQIDFGYADPSLMKRLLKSLNQSGARIAFISIY